MEQRPIVVEFYPFAQAYLRNEQTIMISMGYADANEEPDEICTGVSCEIGYFESQTLEVLREAQKTVYLRELLLKIKKTVAKARESDDTNDNIDFDKILKTVTRQSVAYREVL